MSTHRSLRGFWGSCAVGPSAILLAATTPAGAGEMVISQASASAQSPIGKVNVGHVGIIKKRLTAFEINFGTPSSDGSGDCGSITELYYEPDADQWGVSGTIKFAADSGCNPVSITQNTDGTLVVVTSAGGANGGGSTITFSNGLHEISNVQAPASESLVGATLEFGGDAQPLNGARTGSTNVFITGSYPIYEAQLSDGGLSTPSKIFAFSTENKGGFAPYGPAVMGADGNLYGTTNQGGAHGFGVVYKLTPVTNGETTTWTETVLHAFVGGADGGRPEGQLAIDSVGNLYGTTSMGGALNGLPTDCQNNGFAGCGIVFKLDYSLGTGPWKEHVLYAFSGGADGAIPEAGVVLDAGDNVYGTTFAGGNTLLAACSGAAVENMTPGCGVVFEHTKKGAQTVLYAFAGGADGAEPQGPVTLDGKDVYGTTVAGGDTSCPQGLGLGYAEGCGVVFEITP